MSGFRELVVWQKSKQLAVAIYKLTADGKFCADYGYETRFDVLR